MTYINEICPVCGKAFTQKDDIVVCPECGTPHHRQCYADNKGCKNEALHAEGYEWKPQAESASDGGKTEPTVKPQPVSNDDGHKIVFCPNCGKENPAEEPVCTNCGARLYNNGEKGPLSQPVMLPNMSNQQFGTPVVQISPDDTIGGNKVSDTAEYIQLNATRYIPKFYKMEKTGSKISFNWAAFLFTPYWFFFRKMQIAGFCLMLVLLVTTGCCTTKRMASAANSYQTTVEAYYQGNATQEEVAAASKTLVALPEMTILFAVEAAVRVFGGMFGNYFYKKKAVKEITELRQNSESPEDYRIKLFKKGGISATMCVLSIVGYYCAEQIISMLISKS